MAFDAPNQVISQQYYETFTQLARPKAHAAQAASEGAYGGQDWVSRVAHMTYTCAMENQSKCRVVVQNGLFDDALFVRTHALRFVDKAGFTIQERKRLKTELLMDSRNYRRGKPLWVIHLVKEKIW